MTEVRLASHVMIGALVRLASANGDFVAVLQKGDRISGAILLSIAIKGVQHGLLERMPATDGKPRFASPIAEKINQSTEISQYLQRRRERDPDLWIVELDIACDERLNPYLAVFD